VEDVMRRTVESSAISLLALVIGMCAPWGCSDDDGGGTVPDGALPDGSVDGTAADADQQDGDVEPDGGQAACVPETATFWVYDLSVMPPEYIEVPATCRAAGDHGLVFVADEAWANPITEGEVAALSEAFESVTPADAARGIFDLTTQTFGEPTDVDQNDRVFLLLMELPSYQGNYFDGYIRREDMLGGSYSNDAEVLYLDGVRNSIDTEYMLGVVAHEFFHMIHINHDTAEEHWLDETLAEASMVLCGYLGDLGTWVADFASNPNVTLTDNAPTFHYGAGLLFGTYLLERFGEVYLAALVESAETGIASLENTLLDLGYDDTFPELLGDWAVANYLDDPTVGDGRYGYESFDLPELASVGPYAVGESAELRQVVPAGSFYYVFDVGTLSADSSVEVMVSSPGWQDLELRLVTMPSGQTGQAAVTAATPTAADTAFQVQGVGGSIDRLVVVVASTASSDVSVEGVSVTSL
jgi:hypothetical protein